MVERIAEVQTLQESDNGDVRRVERICRVHQKCPQDTGHAVPKHLTRENLEDGDRRVKLRIVEQICGKVNSGSDQNESRRTYRRNDLHRNSNRRGRGRHDDNNRVLLDVEGTGVEVLSPALGGNRGYTIS